MEERELHGLVRGVLGGCTVVGIGCAGGCLAVVVGLLLFVGWLLPDAPPPPPPLTLDDPATLRAELLAAHNEIRETPLAVDARLQRAAQDYADVLAATNHVAHEGLDGSRPIDRANAAGYVGDIGENIASGQDTAREAIQGWIDSPGHHRNMLRREWVDVGFGIALGEHHGHRYLYWVALFGRRKSETSSTTPAG